MKLQTDEKASLEQIYPDDRSQSNFMKLMKHIAKDKSDKAEKEVTHGKD